MPSKPRKPMRSILDLCRQKIRSLQRGMQLQGLDQRGTVAISFAVAAMPIALGVAAAVDFASITAGRAALQRAVDNAALSGAAAYIAYTPSDALNGVAKSTAASAFCGATQALPNGFAINAASGSIPCGAAQGAVVNAQIAGYQTGTPGFSTGAGCSASQTVVSGYTCGFAVTVSATATTSTTFAGLLGASHTVSVTATAINPFIDLSGALKASLKSGAWNANSLWVYPLRLNAEGQPDFSTSTGALPEVGSCTGDPTQTWCGSYSMLASTKYANCTDKNPCTIQSNCLASETCETYSTTFAGTGVPGNTVGGVVQNVHASSVVVTATTPLGIALQSAAGGNGNPESGIGYNKYGTKNPKGCTFPNDNSYNTIPQAWDSLNKPIYTFTKKDPQGNVIKDASNNPVQFWIYPTHWFYSSYLSNSLPPSQALIDNQSKSDYNSDTATNFNNQHIKPIQVDRNLYSQPDPCYDENGKAVLPENIMTTYPASGNTNCSVYIVKNSLNFTSDSSYNGKCFSPGATPGRQYATLSCQNYGKDNFTFFWNDMGGYNGNPPNYGDNLNYIDGVLTINCSAIPKILLIN